jgi:hypothetical protein
MNFWTRGVWDEKKKSYEINQASTPLFVKKSSARDWFPCLQLLAKAFPSSQQITHEIFSPALHGHGARGSSYKICNNVTREALNFSSINLNIACHIRQTSIRHFLCSFDDRWNFSWCEVADCLRGIDLLILFIYLFIFFKISQKCHWVKFIQVCIEAAAMGNI